MASVILGTVGAAAGASLPIVGPIIGGTLGRVLGSQIDGAILGGADQPSRRLAAGRSIGAGFDLRQNDSLRLWHGADCRKYTLVAAH